MRKNMKAVIDAFRKGESHTEKTCRTDGKTIWSYALEIAQKMSDGTVVVLPVERSPSRTTTSQIRAIAASLCSCGSASEPTLEAGRDGYRGCPNCGMV